MVNKVIVYIIFIIIFIIIISLYGLLASLHPRKFVSEAKPSDLGLKYENVRFKTSDDVLIRGWFIPAKNKTSKTIMVCHGYPFDKGNVLGFAPFLHEKYNLLFFDFRYFGESEGRYTTAGMYETRDVLAAVEYLKKRNQTIGAIGFSLGSSTLLSANSPDIKAIVADSPYASLDLMIKSLYRQFFIFKYPFVWSTELIVRLIGWDIKETAPINTIKDAKAPVLLIHGSKDDQINVKNSKLLHEANPKTELWIADANHGQVHFLYEEEYEKRVLEFFEKNLR